MHDLAVIVALNSCRRSNAPRARSDSERAYLNRLEALNRAAIDADRAKIARLTGAAQASVRSTYLTSDPVRTAAVGRLIV